MSKQLENSLAVFARRTDGIAGKFLGGIVILFLALGLVMAAAASDWGFTSIFAITIAAAGSLAYFSNRRLRDTVLAGAAERLGWETAVPDIQRQNLNIEVIELAKVLDVDPDHLTELQSAYIVAEDLALRQIQQTEGAPLSRHVAIAGVPFDAVMMKSGTIFCIEVAFLVTPELRQDRTDAIMRKVAAVSSAVEQLQLNAAARLMLVLVTQLTPEDEDLLRKRLGTHRFAGTPVDIDIRLLDFENLQRVYVTD